MQIHTRKRAISLGEYSLVQIYCNVILAQIKSSLWQKLSQSLSAVKGPGPPEIQSLKEKYVGSRVSSAE